MEPTGKDIGGYIAAAFAAATISTPAAALSGAEGQSVRPRVDFNESGERAAGPLAGRGERFQLFNDCER